MTLSLPAPVPRGDVDRLVQPGDSRVTAALPDVGDGQAGEDPAGSFGRAGGVPGEGEPCLGVSPAVEGDEALAEHGQRFGRCVAALAGGADCLVEIGGCGVVVAALGGVPDTPCRDSLDVRRIGSA